jgi:peptidoglycan/LPS O-acetylase OafA/YrhL
MLMDRRSEAAAYLISAVAGAAIWVVTTQISGRREAWDATIYWTAGYPAALAIAGILGALVPRHAWRWGLVLMWAQALALAVYTSSYGALPLGLILFGVLAVPPMSVAEFAGALRRRRGAAAR